MSDLVGKFVPDQAHLGALDPRHDLAEVVDPVLQRAFDTGTEGYVLWLTSNPNPSPSPLMTTPEFTGILENYGILQQSGPPPVAYVQRAFDDGTGGYVQWQTLTPDPNPAPSDTTPNFTGSLSGYSIVQVIT